MMDHSVSRLYQLRSHPSYGFYTGRTGSGQQVLMGQSYNRIRIILFAANGTLERGEEHQFLATERIPLDLTPQEQESFQIALHTHMQALDFIEQPIAVYRFAIWDVGIELLPSHFLDFLEDESAFPSEDRKWYWETIHQWQQNEDFVFYWSEDYYCNKQGKVTSS